MLETGKGRKKPFLNILGQGGRNSVQIHFLGIESFGFDKDLVAVPVGKSDHLVFDGGTVPRSGTPYFSAEQGGAVKVLLNDPVGTGVCVGDPAGTTRSFDMVMGEGKSPGEGHLIKLGLDAKLEEKRIIDIVEQTNQALRKWQKHAQAHGVTGSNIEIIGQRLSSG